MKPFWVVVVAIIALVIGGVVVAVAFPRERTHTVVRTIHTKAVPRAYIIDLTCPNGLVRHLTITPNSRKHGQMNCQRHH